MLCFSKLYGDFNYGLRSGIILVKTQKISTEVCISHHVERHLAILKRITTEYLTMAMNSSPHVISVAALRISWKSLYSFPFIWKYSPEIQSMGCVSFNIAFI